MMEKPKKSQIVKLSLIAALLFITPLLSSSLRTTYLYFIINLLIISLSADAGLLSFFSKPPHDKKLPAPPPPPPPPFPHFKEPVPPATAVEKSLSEKIVGPAAKLSTRVRKSPSTPSIFFIGGGEAELEEAPAPGIEEADQEEADGLSGQELFTKAETFIGNFYKQLKMQREESWKRLHDLYHKAF